MTNLAIVIVAGVVAVACLISATVLLLNGVKVPDQIWALMGSSSGTAVLGAAVTQGSSLAGKGTPNIDRLYRNRVR